MSECEACGQEKPSHSDIGEVMKFVVEQALKRAEDEIMYGVSCRCTECKLRLDPREKVADIEGERTVKEMFRDEQTDEPKFLEGESLAHGME